MKKDEATVTRRLPAYRTAFFLVTLFLVARLVDVQLFDRENLRVKAIEQYQYEVKLPPERGKIVDRNMSLLAFNIPKVDVFAHPSQVEEPESAAIRLAQILGLSRASLLSKLRSDEFVYLARRQPKEIGDMIRRLGIAGIEVQTVSARHYPKGQTACQLIGFINVDGKGLSGTEYSFDATLRGLPGKAILQRTGKSKLFVHSEYPVISPEDGGDIVLTIDARYQTIAEKELCRTVQEMEAESGVVVIMEPGSAQVLAMASEPHFDPNNAGLYDPASWRLRAITDQYEPGSTFKVGVLAAVLNERLSKPSDIVFCENGRFDVMNESLHDTSPYAWLTLEDVLVKSSNIGMAKTALKADRDILYEYARAFGFGEKSGIELKGEVSGTLKKLSEWSGFTPVAMSIGYEIAATPIQMCNMYCAIANGGFLLRPTILKEIRKHNRRVMKNEVRVIRRVISPSTADTVRNIMHQAVKRGTASRVDIPEIEICGKTGTARVASQDQPGFIPNKYLASFGGFLPREKPKLCIFVMIYKPQKHYYGSDVAAPCFKRITERIIALEGLDYFKVNGEFEAARRLTPNLVGSSRGAALKRLRGDDIAVELVGDGSVVISQSPGAGEPLPEAKPMMLITGGEEGSRAVPRLIGLPVRNALNLLAARGIKVVVDGSGHVVEQQPPPDTELEEGEQVLLRCQTSLDLRKLMTL